jgi:anthranilate phosphoribosyltransferase
VLINSAAVFWTAGLDDTLENGIERAAELIDSGAAAAKLKALVQFTQRCVPFSFSTVAQAG